MAVANLNNTSVPTDQYSDALTVLFSFGRPSFALHVFNAAIYYQLATTPMQGQSGVPDWEPAEHFLPPSLSTFKDPVAEGFAPDRKFAGIRIRGATAVAPDPLPFVTVA